MAIIDQNYFREKLCGMELRMREKFVSPVLQTCILLYSHQKPEGFLFKDQIQNLQTHVNVIATIQYVLDLYHNMPT